ncbi:sodium:calcium antiporter [Roseibium salinum]|uniref:Sodium:calcium antiporter n=1 Tax=Roseibium salinum TaxID=1604349 RepID=A0ABT3R3U7_9HYPH|nr:sodium:calcium antiporter [Roseibium sp. DSM 29163]MCX2723936.1 sodium:calcium antiporter [Roseibium sp. DSM 29163]
MLSGVSYWILIAVFAGATVAVVVAGVRVARTADTLADRTNLGEVIAGALFVGASTSLPGAITSVSTAAQGFPSLAVGNALGGLTAQTAFLVIADIAYRRANLEHAAASATGLTQGVLLVVLLSLPLIASVQPAYTIWGVHPVSILTVLAYAAGLRLLRDVSNEPMWKPVQTSETREEVSSVSDAEARRSMSGLWTEFAIAAAVTALAGYVVGQVGIELVNRSGISATLVGTALLAVVNSLPELVTAIAAVRIGAVSLAVGDVIGGNAFEVLFLSAADVVSEGSIYAAFTWQDQATALFAMLMTGVLLLGLIRRERCGFGGIGFESALVLFLYAVSIGQLFL